MSKAHRAYRYSWWEQKFSAAGIFGFRKPEESEQKAETYYTWRIADVRRTLDHIGRLREHGFIPPLQSAKPGMTRKDKYGYSYRASKGELQQAEIIEDCASIDCYGNLVIDGQIVKYAWLQSFDNDKKREKREAAKWDGVMHKHMAEADAK